MTRSRHRDAQIIESSTPVTTALCSAGGNSSAQIHRNMGPSLVYRLYFDAHPLSSFSFKPISLAISSSFLIAPENSNSPMSVLSASSRAFSTCPR